VRTASFAPVVGVAPRVLVLGSMPGQRSLAEQQYYAHPRNLFWTFMGELFGAGPELSYPDRLARLTESGVALWDVLARCERPGSLDSAIVRTTEVPNAIGPLLDEHPAFRLVACNGGTATRLFERHILPGLPSRVLERVRVVSLPSTSPANAGVALATKRAAWAVIGPAAQGRDV
jgi:TDG/mug DNA glycosylase family protein